MYTFFLVLGIIIGLNGLKAMTIGSDFNFYFWAKYGRIYSDWYVNREKFLVYLVKSRNNARQ